MSARDKQRRRWLRKESEALLKGTINAQMAKLVKRMKLWKYIAFGCIGAAIYLTILVIKYSIR